MVQAQMVEKYVQVNGLRLHYVDWGDPGAPEVVCLHGFRSYGHTWDHFSCGAATRFRVMALDQRGRGASDWTPDGDYSTEAYVSDAEEFVRELGLGPFVLLGHSMGGRNAIVYAGKHPEQIRALVVVDIGPEINRERAQTAGAWAVGNVEDTPEEFGSWDEARAYLLKERPHIQPESLALRLEWAMKEENGKVVWRYDPIIRQRRGGGVPPESLWPWVERITCPTLVVRGQHSDTLTAEGAEKFVGALKDGHFVEIPESGHDILGDNPEAFTREVLRFFEGQGLTA